jgi:hypothetical protein
MTQRMWIKAERVDGSTIEPIEGLNAYERYSQER